MYLLDLVRRRLKFVLIHPSSPKNLSREKVTLDGSNQQMIYLAEMLERETKLQSWSLYFIGEVAKRLMCGTANP